jgi:WD40 repeat protein
MVILPKDPLEKGYRLLSGSEDASIRIWDLDSGDCQSVLEQDAGISCLLVSPRLGFEDKLVFFGDQVNFFSFNGSMTDSSQKFYYAFN